MGKFIKIVDKIFEKDKSLNTMNEVNSILDIMFDKLKAESPSLYKETIDNLENIEYRITREDAEKVVMEMKPYGQKWSYDEIRDYLATKGIDTRCEEFYLVMNMAMNDYYGLAEMVNMAENTDFYFEFSKAFIFDVDAKPHKVAKYFM